MIVEDNNEMRETLEQLFSFFKFSVFTAENGKVAVDLAEKELPDIILLDAYMPVMDGFEACQKLKENYKTKDIPVVFLSAKYIEPESKIEGFKLGADDYILKPFNSKELVTRIRTILKKTSVLRILKEKNEKLSLSNERISKEMRKIKLSRNDLEKSIITDPLTGLYNKSYFLKRLKEEFNRALRYDISQSIIFIEIDSFENIIEHYGNQMSDYILMKMANIVLNNTRLVDIPARYDTNRFAIVLPQTEEQGSYFEGEKLRILLGGVDYLNESILEINTSLRKQRPDLKKITVSLGIATYSSELKIKNEIALLNNAKEALLLARANGKNRTTTYSNPNKNMPLN